MSQNLKFRQLPGPYGILRRPPDAPIPDWATRGDFNSFTRTTDELSIVCPAENIPIDIESGPRWICFKLEGPFPFSQTVVLLTPIEPLSNSGIPIFAISTYDTDYVLVHEEFAGATLQALDAAGHERLPRDESWRKFIKEGLSRSSVGTIQLATFPEQWSQACIYPAFML